jgi:hypothetical protein
MLLAFMLYVDTLLNVSDIEVFHGLSNYGLEQVTHTLEAVLSRNLVSASFEILVDCLAVGGIP